MCRRLTPPQLAAVVALALGERPGWAVHLVARLHLRPADEVERETLLGGLDAIAADSRSGAT